MNARMPVGELCTDGRKQNVRNRGKGITFDNRRGSSIVAMKGARIGLKVRYARIDLQLYIATGKWIKVWR